MCLERPLYCLCDASQVIGEHETFGSFSRKVFLSITRELVCEVLIRNPDSVNHVVIYQYGFRRMWSSPGEPVIVRLELGLILAV